MSLFLRPSSSTILRPNTFFADNFFNRELSLLDRHFDEISKITRTQPNLDVWEEKDSIKVNVELAGFSKDKIKLDVHDGQLLVWAENEQVDDRKYFHRESVTSVKRSVQLPHTADLNKISVEFVDGVLKVDVK